MPDKEDPTPPEPKSTDSGKSFTQDQVDKIVNDRLAREKGKYSDYEDLKAKAAQLDELEQSKKDDATKANDKATAAEERAAKAEANALRLQVALDKGLTAAQAKRLTGATLEELEADAAELAELFGTGTGNGTNGPPSGKPAADLRGGTDPTEDPEETDPRKLAANVPRL
jgi:ParB-like chromosome segregation protein Spo0J